MSDQDNAVQAARPSTASLSPEQRGRVEAAAAVRWLLGPSGADSVIDLVALAEWVLTGREPYGDAEQVDLPASPPLRSVQIAVDERTDKDES